MRAIRMGTMARKGLTAIRWLPKWLQLVACICHTGLISSESRVRPLRAAQVFRVPSDASLAWVPIVCETGLTRLGTIK